MKLKPVSVRARLGQRATKARASGRLHGCAVGGVGRVWRTASFKYQSTRDGNRNTQNIWAHKGPGENSGGVRVPRGCWGSAGKSWRGVRNGKKLHSWRAWESADCWNFPNSHHDSKTLPRLLWVTLNGNGCCFLSSDKTSGWQKKKKRNKHVAPLEGPLCVLIFRSSYLGKANSVFMLSIGSAKNTPKTPQYSLRVRTSVLPEKIGLATTRVEY